MSLVSGHPSQCLRRCAEKSGFHEGEYALAKGAEQRGRLEYRNTSQVELIPELARFL